VNFPAAGTSDHAEYADHALRLPSPAPAMPLQSPAPISTAPAGWNGQTSSVAFGNPERCGVVGGLISSQLLTLFTTPVVYLCLDLPEGSLCRLRSRSAQIENDGLVF
jgi:hypothetical protein